MKGQLPKAYLRLDPLIDSHPDWTAMVALILWANRQLKRGYFRSLENVRKTIGKKRLQACIDRQDLIQLPDGSFHLVGWEEWQEGDHTVGERVRRCRDRRSTTVTSPLPDRKPPSEALRRQGVKALTDNGNGLPPPADPSPTEVWSREASEDWITAKGGQPPGRIFPALKRAVTAHGWQRVRPVWQFYLATVGSEFVVVDKLVSAFGEWEKRARGQPAPGGVKQTTGAATMAAAARVLARHEGRRT